MVWCAASQIKSVAQGERKRKKMEKKRMKKIERSLMGRGGDGGSWLNLGV